MPVGHRLWEQPPSAVPEPLAIAKVQGGSLGLRELVSVLKARAIDGSWHLAKICMSTCLY